jgi:hypothetical protein
MTYELWHLTGGSMIDSFEDRSVALEAVQTYLDADEAEQVALVVRDEAGAIVTSPTGQDHIEWAERQTAPS